MPALVDLAMFQMQRDSDNVGANCHAKAGGKDVDLQDFDCAKLNLQRALAIDDGYMPAFNQLALYYFGSAKKKAGSGKKFGRTIATNAALAKRGDVQQLELAALVCSQAVRKSAELRPDPQHLGPHPERARAGEHRREGVPAAAQLDPHFFEAQMNLAAINLSFRGFDKAEAAYRKALEMHPNDYDAHLGLALALRGQIDDTNYDKQVAAVQSELDTCKKLDARAPRRVLQRGDPDAGVQGEERGRHARRPSRSTGQAKQVFQTFLDKASGKTEYDGAVKKTKERMQDIDDTVTFLQAGGPSTPAAGGPPAPAAGAAAPAAAGSAAPAAAPAPAAKP